MTLTKQVREHERIHLLLTLGEYGPLTASDLRSRMNEECSLEMFDYLPLVSPQGITAKLNALSVAGLVTGSGHPIEWEATDKGKALAEDFRAAHWNEAA